MAGYPGGGGGHGYNDGYAQNTDSYYQDDHGDQYHDNHGGQPAAHGNEGYYDES